MTSKLVSKFRRSLSFPNQPSSSSKPPKALHIRSASLPSASHPSISLLTSNLLSLSSSKSPTTPSIIDGLTRLRAVHSYLDSHLNLPQTIDSLRLIPDFIEKVLEAFLKLIDVFRTFHTLMLSLKHKNSLAQMAIRRKDYSKFPLFLKDFKKIGKEMQRLVSTVRSTDKCDDEIMDVDFGCVIEATMWVSIWLFKGISIPLSRNTSLKGIEEFDEIRTECLRGLSEKGDEGVRMMVLKRMQEMERCIGEIEVCSERVLRSLINTRVSLLNVLSTSERL